MAILGKRFSASTAQLTTGATTLYTATAIRAQVHAANFLNTSGGAVTVTLHLVPEGGALGDANMIMKAKALNAGEAYKSLELIGQWLNPGDTIQALASADTAVSVMIGGAEYSA